MSSRCARRSTSRAMDPKTAFRSLSPLRFERPPPRPGDEGASSLEDVAPGDQSATPRPMPGIGPSERALVDALDDPALIVDGTIVRLANRPALEVLGAGIEGRDLRLAIRHPQALEHILAGTSA